MRHETRMLMAVLIIFDISYVMRWLYDSYISVLIDDNPNLFFPASISIGVFFDLIPLTIVLVYHIQNFKQVQTDDSRSRIPVSEAQTDFLSILD